jgi:hypothetical protein
MLHRISVDATYLVVIIGKGLMKPAASGARTTDKVQMLVDRHILHSELQQMLHSHALTPVSRRGLTSMTHQT